MDEWLKLIPKEFVLPIEINGKIKKFKFKQWTMKQCLDYHYQEKDRIFRLYDFLNTHAITRKDKLKKKEFGALNFEVLMKQLYSTLMKDFYRSEGKKTTIQTSILSSSLVLIGKELNLNPVELINELTPEMFKEYSDGVMWNLNLRSKDGTKKNKNILAKRKAESYNKELTDNLFKSF